MINVDKDKLFLVSGCGVSFQATADTLQGWIDLILEKGGAPIVTLWGQK